MALTEYKKKRSLDKTPEPAGGKSEDKVLRFVVQKHEASRLHYDFRLEMNGVLKSWAVPKGPSLNLNVKRLAMMVEDHPYDYCDFEGIIPEGNYGAGTVMVWDEGTYHAAEGDFKNKQSEDKNLQHQLQSGKIKFSLSGKKLKGEFALVKASGRGENSWLLMKLKDKYATTEDILTKEKSALSGKTLDQIKKNPKRTHGRKAVKRSSANSETKKILPRHQKKRQKINQQRVVLICRMNWIRLPIRNFYPA